MIIKTLNKIANNLEQRNMVQEASQVDSLILMLKDRGLKKIAQTSNIITILNNAVMNQQNVRIYYTKKADGTSAYYDVSPYEIKDNKFWANHQGTTHSFILGNIENAEIVGAMPAMTVVPGGMPGTVGMQKPVEQAVA